jgi:hypothetical protein
VLHTQVVVAVEEDVEKDVVEQVVVELVHVHLQQLQQEQ